MGNSFAAKAAGLGDYVLVTQVERSGGNIQGYTYTAELVFKDAKAANFTVAAPTSKNLFSLYTADTANHVENVLHPYYWSTLASYYEGAEDDAADYYLLNPETIEVEKDKTTIAYEAIQKYNDDATEVAADLSKGSRYVGINVGENKGNDVTLTSSTEIYIVTGVTEGYTHEALLLDAKYVVGYQNLPQILGKNIHGIYGIVETTSAAPAGGAGAAEPVRGGNTQQVEKPKADETKTALVLVIEVSAESAGEAGFAYGTTKNIENIYVNRTSNNAAESKVDIPGFVVIDDGEYVRNAENGQDMLWSDEWTGDDHLTISQNKTHDGDLELSKGVRTGDKGYVSKDVPVYAIIDGKLVTLVENARPGSDEVQFDAGDFVVLVSHDLASATNWNSNYQTNFTGVDYVIDVTKSDTDVKTYFDYKVEVTATANVAEVVTFANKKIDDSDNKFKETVGILDDLQYEVSWDEAAYDVKLTIKVGGETINEATKENPNGYTLEDIKDGKKLLTIPGKLVTGDVTIEFTCKKIGSYVYLINEAGVVTAKRTDDNSDKNVPVYKEGAKGLSWGGVTSLTIKIDGTITGDATQGANEIRKIYVTTDPEGTEADAILALDDAEFYDDATGKYKTEYSLNINKTAYLPHTNYYIHVVSAEVVPVTQNQQESEGIT